MQLVKLQEAAKLLGGKLSVYELRNGIQEGRFPCYWTRNKKRLLVDPEAIQACIRAEMEKAQHEARAAYEESLPSRRG